MSDRISDWDFSRHAPASSAGSTYVRGDTLVLRPPAEKTRRSSWTTPQSLVELQLTQDITRAVGSAVGVAWDTGSLEASSRSRAPPRRTSKWVTGAAHDTAVGDAGWPLRGERAESPAVPASDEADARAVAGSAGRAGALLRHRGGPGRPGDAVRRWLTDHRCGHAAVRAALRHRRPAPALGRRLPHGVPGRACRRSSPPRPSRAPSGPLVLATVESLDDPDSANRVKVRLPWRQDNGGRGLGAGGRARRRGRLRHRVRAEVRPGGPGRIRRRRRHHPVVLGSLYNGTQQPPLAIDPDANAVRAIVTPGGHTLTLDDDAPAFTLTSGKGNSVALDDSDSKIVLTHKDSGNAVTVSSGRHRAQRRAGRHRAQGRVRRREARLDDDRGQGQRPVEDRELGHLRPQGLRSARAQGRAGNDQLVRGDAMPAAARVGDTTVHGGTVVGPGGLHGADRRHARRGARATCTPA